MPESTLEAFNPASTTARSGVGRLIAVVHTKRLCSKRGIPLSVQSFLA